MGQIRLLIADDHVLVRDGTRRILEDEKDFRVIGEAGDGEEAVMLASQLKPDLAIVDIAMPKLDGIEVTKKIKECCPATAVLILTAYDDDQFVFNLLAAGAAGYLLKSVRSQELVEAIRAVHSGESVLHPTIARKVLDRFITTSHKSKKPEQLEILSHREMEVMKLVTRGLSNKDIADELCISLRTVQTHLGSIFSKLGVGSRTEAVVRALKEGWVNIKDVP
jgi:DNA-binding NarL/FixJ family response regulator